MKKLSLKILALAATIFGSNAAAFDPEDLQKLIDTGVCYECELSEFEIVDTNSLIKYSLESANLESANMVRANLERANLRDANLKRANLTGANLVNADLSGANLSGADLIMTYMNDAILCNTTMPNGSVIYNGC